MTDFIMKKLSYEFSSHVWLVFIGKYLRRINLAALIDPKCPVRSGVATDVRHQSAAQAQDQDTT